MKKIIAFIILVILIILIITCSYNYYKKQSNDKSRINKLKSDLDTSEILDNKSSKDDDIIEVEEKDASTQKADEEEANKKDNKNSEAKKDSKKSNDNNKSNSSDEEDVDNSSIDNEEETHLDVPDTASDDNSGFVKLNYYTIDTINSTIKVGKTTKVIVNYYPENASVKDTTFVSETKNICKVSSLGKVTGLKKGTCSIVVRVKDQSSKSLLLTVK